MRFSILHLSDLHRDRADDLSNGWLVESLVRDCEHYEGSGIPRPSLCLVTGDLIFGVGADADGAAEEVEKQYQQAEEFLISTANRFFKGERDRIVILPGNHDVFYPGAMASMKRADAPATRPERIGWAAQMQHAHTDIRWSWADLCFYRVSDEGAYQARLKPFAAFYERFYSGRRTYSLDPAQQFHVFDFPDLGFCILALNSCYGNDPLRRVGAIHPDCLAEGSRALRQPHRAGWVAAAAWHHNLVGPPVSDDYLDVQVLQLLIDSGVSLAFHGHQHRQDCVDERFQLGPSSRKITVVSAGTLCASSRHLAPGAPRSYNVVELDTVGLKGTVHLRQMLTRPPTMPLWGPGTILSSSAPQVSFDVCPPPSRRPEHLDVTLELEGATRLIGEGKWTEAVSRLLPIRANDLARPLLLKALVELGDVPRILADLWPPESAGEAVTIGGVVIEVGTREQAETFLGAPFVRDSSDASVRDMACRIRERKLR